MSVSCLSIKFPLPPPTSLYNFNSPPKFSPRNHLHLRAQRSICKSIFSSSSISNFIYPLQKPSNLNLHVSGCGGGSNGNNNNNSNGGNGDCWWRRWSDDDDNEPEPDSAWIRNLLLIAIPFLTLPAIAVTLSNDGVWEIRGGRRTRLVPTTDFGSFIPIDSDVNQKNGKALILGFEDCIRRIRDLFLNLMLPEGYPTSVSSDYMQYSLWRGLQGIASQTSGVLATQSLLYAVGLGKGAIPAAAAVNWVLKDGIGYLSKILLSNFGRHFDVNPKGWRLFADLLENAAYGLEILTPAFPQQFVLIGSAAGAGRSAATLIQAATRSCFFAGFAIQRNSAEVIAKGEAQGMVSKFIGITIGIGLANYVGSSTPLALAVFTAVTGFHMYCNVKSYQSIQLRTLNPYRGSLVFSEYLISGLVPEVKDVNAEEPFYPGLLPSDNTCMEQAGTLTAEAKNAAAEICKRLRIGCKPSELVKNKEDAFALFELFKDERYIVMESEGRFCVVLQEGCSPQDMLKSLFHVNYLYWLEKNVQMEPTSVADECKHGGKLCMSLDYVQREFGHIKQDGLESGWFVNDGLIARPSPYRIRVIYAQEGEVIKS